MDGHHVTRADSRGPIVFYDGDCGLCHGFVQFILAHDTRGQFRFAALQGETAAMTIPTHVGPSLASVVFQDDSGAVFTRSDATLRAISRLGGTWRLANVLRVIPRPLRDAVYAFVARHRYGWFGAAEVCVLPPAAVRRRFLS
jgi:predicted DCC family thiol-disulfide oxidoreductase YuxK